MAECRPSNSETEHRHRQRPQGHHPLSQLYKRVPSCRRTEPRVRGVNGTVGIKVTENRAVRRENPQLFTVDAIIGREIQRPTHGREKAKLRIEAAAGQPLKRAFTQL